MQLTHLFKVTHLFKWSSPSVSLLGKKHKVITGPLAISTNVILEIVLYLVKSLVCLLSP